LGLIFDTEPKNGKMNNTLVVIPEKENFGNFRNLLQIRKSMEKLRKWAQILFEDKGLVSKVWNMDWIVVKVTILYWSLFFLKTLTWNRVILGLLFNLGKIAFEESKESQLKTIMDALNFFLSFFKNHLTFFF